MKFFINESWIVLTSKPFFVNLKAMLQRTRIFFKCFSCCATHKRNENLIRTMSFLHNSEILWGISCMIISRLTYMENHFYRSNRASSVKIDKNSFYLLVFTCEKCTWRFLYQQKTSPFSINRSQFFIIRYKICLFFHHICRYLSTDNKTRSSWQNFTLFILAKKKRGKAKKKKP